MKPMICCSGEVASPSAIIAPTSTMPCTKFDPDISGVCRITGTREMISWPVKAASMNRYSARNPSIIFVAPSVTTFCFSPSFPRKRESILIFMRQKEKLDSRLRGNDELRGTFYQCLGRFMLDLARVRHAGLGDQLVGP